MRLLIALLTVSILFISCKKKKPEKVDAQFLNGYWEIDYVIMNDGSKKEYNFNEYVDYFETKNKTGFRTKVKPNFNRKYTSNFQKINYTLEKKNDTILIKYKSSTTIITEKLFSTNKNKLGIKSENGNLYFYKKYLPVIIED